MKSSERLDQLEKDIIDLVATVRSLASEVGFVKTLTKEHDDILIRGSGGNAPLKEDVHVLTEFMKSIRFWVTTLAITFIGQFVAVAITTIITIMQVLPLLKNLVENGN